MAIFNSNDMQRIVLEAVQKEFANLKQDLEQEIKDQNSILYWDTETTGSNAQTALPISLGTYQKGISQNFFLSYANKGKKADGQTLVQKHKKTIDTIMKAANIPDKINGGVIASSNQIWKTFTGKDAPKNFNTKENNDALKTAVEHKFGDANWVKQNVVDADYIEKLLVKNAKTGLAGYNTESFDVNVIKNYVKQRGINIEAKSHAKLKQALNSTRDIRKSIRGSVKSIEDLTGISSDFLGSQKLQDIITLITGQSDINAHSGDADAYSTALVDANLETINKVYEFAMNKAVELAQKNGMSITSTNSKGQQVYSTEFKNFFTDIIHGIGTNIVSANNINKTNNINNANAISQINNELKSQISQEARKKVQEIYNYYGNTGNKSAQKALTGAHLLERMKRLGKDVSNLTPAFYGQEITNTSKLAEGSTAYYLAKIADTAEANGMGVEFYPDADGGLSIGLYNKEDMVNGTIDNSLISKIQIGMVDKEGMLSLGNQKKINMLVPDVQFKQDSQGNWDVQSILSTVQEQQLDAIERTLSSENFLGKMKRRDFTSASHLLKYVRNQQFKQAPSGNVAQSVLDEIGIKSGRKNPEENIGLMQRVSFNKIIQSLYSSKTFKDTVNNIYQELYNEDNTKNYKYKNKTVDVYNLTPDERNAITVAIGLMANDSFNEEDMSAVNAMEDSVTKRILNNKQLRNLIRADISPFISNGLIPTSRSLKEEHILSGQWTFGGSEDISFGGYLTDPSNRAETQKYNYNLKANPQKALRSPFYSQIGIKNNIDYNNLGSQGYYQGATTTDSQIYPILQEILKESQLAEKEQQEILAQFSVAEGGIILPKSMTKELAVYRDFVESVSKSDKTIKRLSSITGITEADLRNAQVGQEFSVMGGYEVNQRTYLGNDLQLRKNDIINSIRKTSKGFEVIGGYYEKAKEGTKILSGTAGRYTFRGINDDIFNKLMERMGLSGANFLVEEEGISQRKLPTAFRGKIGYIITQAQQLGKTTEEITQALKAMPVWGKAIKEKDGQYDLDVFYDSLSHQYQYYDDKGNVKSLFGTNDKGEEISLTEEELNAIIAKALVESETGSSISQLGKTLLGEDGYANSLKMIATTLNTARVTPYFTPTGGGSAKVAERKHGVKVTTKERDAFNLAMGVYGNKWSESDREGLDIFTKAQQNRMSNYGPQALEAQKNINQLIDVLNNRTKINSRQERIELTWDKNGSWTVQGNKINLANIVTNYEYSDKDDGVDLTDWQNTIGAKIQLLKQLTPNAQLYLNTQAIASATGMDLSGAKYLRLADIVDSDYGKGKMPSITNRALTSFISRIEDAMATDVTIDISEEANRIFDIYGNQVTDKHSSLNESMTSAYLSHATHSKAVGLNQMAVENELVSKYGDKAYNTAFANKGYITQLLRSQKGSSKEDIANNIKELSYMFRASVGDENLNKDAKADLKFMHDSNHYKGYTTQQLLAVEKKIIKYILSYLEDGGLLLSQSHRYPSTSGLDIHNSYLGLNNKVSDGTVAIGRGQSMLFNADYDGDTIQNWLTMAGFRNSEFNGEEGFEQYKKGFEAAQKLAESESQIAKHLAKWEEKNNEGDIDTKIAEDTKALVASVGGKSKVIDISAFMSKYNKQYVGQLSNPYTNYRRSKKKIGYGEIGVNATKEERMRTGYSLLMNAFMESLEQDAISAKKVQARLLNSALNGGSENGDVVLNELTTLTNLMREGKLEEALNFAIDKNIIKSKDGVINGRQFEFARSAIQQSDSEVYNELFGENGEFGVNSKTLIESFKNLEKYAAQKGFSIGELSTSYAVNGKTQGQYKALELVTQMLPQYAGDKSLYNIKGEPEQGTPVKLNADTKYTAILTTDSENFKETHERSGKTLEGNDIGKLDYSVTQLVKPETDLSKLPGEQKQAIEKSSAIGTYLHKILELAIKYGVEDAWEVFDEIDKKENEADKQEILKAYQDVKAIEVAQKGTVAPGYQNKLNQRAVSLYKIAKDQGLITKDTQSEVGLGKFIEGIGTVGGSADLLTFNRDENGELVGATIGDWKFSQAGGANDPTTIAERIMQASEYVHMAQQYYSDILSYMKEKNIAKYTLNKGEEVDVNEISDRIKALNNTDIKILRSYFDSSGKLRAEVLKANVADKNIVEGIMRQVKQTGIADYEALTNYVTRATLEQFDSEGNSVESLSGNAKESKEYAKLAAIARNPEDRNFLSGNTSYEGVTLSESGLEKLSSVLGEIDTSQMSLNKRFSEYGKSLKDSNKAVVEMVKAQTNIADLEAKKKELEQDTTTNNEEAIKLLDQEILKQQILVELAQKKREEADVRREKTGIDAAVEGRNGANGEMFDNKDAVRRHDMLVAAKSDLNNTLAQEAVDRQSQTPVSDKVLQMNKTITEYINSLKQRYQIEAQIRDLEVKMQSQSGEELKNSQKYKQSLEATLRTIKEMTPQINEELLSEEQKEKLIRQQNLLYQKQQSNIEKINAKQKQSQSIATQFINSLKMALRQFSIANIAYTIVGDIRNIVSQVIQYTTEMDSVLVDLQIASGYTREEVHGLMIEYNRLGAELGKSTTEVANAANDWLRAGYDGKEATDLTRASTELATLGMINTSDATSYLISVLKGWKIEAKEVSEVVDKLTVTRIGWCGVCIVICTGHELKCR